MSCDPYFSEVSLLLTFDGANGSTAITDISPVGNTMTVVGGNAFLSTAAPQFGSANGQFTYYGGSGWHTPISPGGPLDLESQSFTVECWIKTAQTSQSIIWSDLSAGTNGFTRGYIFNNSVVLQCVTGTGGSTAASLAGGSYYDGNWHHVVFQANGGTNQAGVAVDGIWGITQTFNLNSNVNANTYFQIGYDALSSAQNTGFVGGIDEMRVTLGQRYTIGTNFTPPVAAFPTIQCNTTVPNVVGDSDSVAQATITNAGFTVGTITSAVSTQPPGTVLAQSPAGGSTATPGSAVNLTESQGVVVPNVVNTSLTVVAPAILAAAGFTVGVVTYAASALVIAGNVISQSPAAGSYAASGSAVALVVSTGLPQLTVPDLFGLTQVEAITLLQSLGLVVGAVSSAPSKFVPAGEVQTQNPQPGTVVAAGAIVSFVLSLGTPAVGTLFDFEATVISQYANSPTILQLVQNLNYYIDQSTNFANFYNNVWNINTAVGFGLDNWGKIVGVSRLLNIPNTTDYVGFYQTGETTQDWQTMGSDQPPQPAVGGALYTGYTASTAYLLPDDSYRQLILAKAFSNICATTAPAINQILQNLYGPGTAYVLNTGPMKISYNLTFTPTLIQEGILLQSGVIPTPPGVAFTVNTNV